MREEHKILSPDILHRKADHKPYLDVEVPIAGQVVCYNAQAKTDVNINMWYSISRKT